MSDYKKTILYDSHKTLKAKLVPFSGFWMPLQYSSIVKEHHHVRKKCGIFDVSHMGEFIVSGQNAEKFLQMVTTNDVTVLKPGKVQYSAFCNDLGGVIDDLLVYHLGDYYMLVDNASNIDKNSGYIIASETTDMVNTNRQFTADNEYVGTADGNRSGGDGYKTANYFARNTNKCVISVSFCIEFSFYFTIRSQRIREIRRQTDRR